MFTRLALSLLAATAWGWSSPHQQSFLHASSAPAEEEMNPNLNFKPMSTTMQCILNLTLQYFVIYTALGITRTVLDFQGKDHKQSDMAIALKQASETMFYAPMVCMMFVGFRMRVLQLTKGQGAPQEWVQFAMKSVTYSILATTLMVLIVPIFTPMKEVEVEETGEIKADSKGNPFESPLLQGIFNVIRYLTVIALYVGFGAVLVGLFKFTPDPAIWDGAVPPISPAVGCTVMLSTAFFLIYFLLAVSRTYSQFMGQGNTFTSKFETVMTRAADTLGMAPMLCALFLGARMRALQMDPVSGNPQRWAQNCFWLCSSALLAQTCVAVAVPFLLNDVEVKKVDKKYKLEGDMDYQVADGQSWLAKGMSAFRFIIMLCVYASAVAVVCSVFTIQHPDGKELTPPLSPTMQCVLNLAFQYFLIYALLWIFITVEDFTSFKLVEAKDAIESAKSTVQFAPMLAVLFIATRMRALQMTDNKGAPQGWVQDGMYLATWSIMIQFMMCLIMPFFLGHKYTPDTLDGEEKPGENDNVGNQYGAMAVTFVRYCALIALLGGVTTVTIGVFMMTPETANGRGAIPVIADGTLPVDLAPEPYGVNDMPGAKKAMKNVGETVGTGVNTVNEAGETVTAPVADVAAPVTGF